MPSAAAENKAQGTAAPQPQLFSLKTPYMLQGRTTPVIAKTPNMKICVKINAEGGENVVHAHLDEDHSFIVLEGEATIFDQHGNKMIVKQYQGVLLPRGAFYRYYASGKGNLVLLRISAPVADKPPAGAPIRVRPNGEEIQGQTEDNKTLPPIKMPGKFFAESAGLD